MQSSIYMHKDNPELPNSYKIKLICLSGKVIVYEVASHRYIDKIPFYDRDGKLISLEVHPTPMIELALVDDKFIQIPLSIGIFEFDENYSKIVAIREKELRDKEKQNEKK